MVVQVILITNSSVSIMIFVTKTFSTIVIFYISERRFLSGCCSWGVAQCWRPGHLQVVMLSNRVVMEFLGFVVECLVNNEGMFLGYLMGTYYLWGYP